MKKIKILLLIAVLLLSGCATVSKEQIKQKAHGGAGVFEEKAAEGYTELIIRASIKKTAKGYYLLESKSSDGKKNLFPFVVNIGGQGNLWTVEGIPDKQERYINGKRNPEGGEGIKYTFEKRLYIKHGEYKAYLGLPDEGYEKEIVVNLKSNLSNTLEFLPVYRYDKRKGQIFLKGISRYEVFLNGVRMD